MLRTCFAISIALCATSALGATFPSPPLYPSFTAQDPQIVKIAPPNSVATYAGVINARGDIAGYYLSRKKVVYGFIRAADGTFTKLQAPDASTQIGEGTQAASMTASDDVAGNYIDSSGVEHGFLRTSDGTFTEFDPPGASNTQVVHINNKGAIVGSFSDSSGVAHGFLRGTRGKFTVFDPPGSIDTSVVGNNLVGTIVGSFSDGSTLHGFVRDILGNFTTFDPPGSVFTDVDSMNESGTIVGSFIDSKDIEHGFIRDASGSFTIVDGPGAGKKKNTVTILIGINKAGGTFGTYEGKTSTTAQAFMRSKAGVITTFAPPKASVTFPVSINDKGAIVGFYLTENALTQKTYISGFLRTQ